MRIEELKNLVLQIRKDMRKVKIPCGKIKEIKIARKNAKYYASTDINSDCTYTITFSGKSLYAGKQSLINTIFHELCHTCIGAFNHGKKFKKYGDIVYKNFGYKIETYSTKEEKQAVKSYKGWMKDILFMI